MKNFYSLRMELTKKIREYRLLRLLRSYNQIIPEEEEETKAGHQQNSKPKAEEKKPEQLRMMETATTVHLILMSNNWEEVQTLVTMPEPMLRMY